MNASVNTYIGNIVKAICGSPYQCSKCKKHKKKTKQYTSTPQILAIKKAISIAGGQKQLGKLCGLSQAAVSKWHRGFQITPENALKVENATQGQVIANELRPDIFGKAA